VTDQQFRIGLYDTANVVPPISTLPVGVHRFRITTVGNSVLSTVYVRSGAGTASVRWFDLGAGLELADTQTTLLTHPTMTAGQTDRRVVTKIHASCFVEVTVAGAPVDMGVLATVVADFPLSGNILDAQLAHLAADGGLPVSVYNPGDGKFYLLRGGPDGLAVSERVGRVLEAGTTLASTGPSTTILSMAPATGVTWRVRYGEVVCRGVGRWNLVVDGVRVGGGATGPERAHDRTDMPGYVLALASVQVGYTYSHGPAGIDIDAFVGVTEL